MYLNMCDSWTFQHHVLPEKILMEKGYAVHLVIKEKTCDTVKGKDHSQLEEIITEAGCREDVRFKVSFRDRC